MTKWIISLILVLLLFPLVYGLEECKDIMQPKDIPCTIRTTWPYTNDCETYTIIFFNSTPTVIGQTYLTNYTGTNLCNTTFNYTDKGSYNYNISSGDSGHITVESEGSEMIVAIIMIGFVLAFLVFMTLHSQTPVLKTLYNTLIFFFVLVGINFAKLTLEDANANANLVKMFSVTYLVMFWITMFMVLWLVIQAAIWAIQTFRQRKEQEVFKAF